MSQIFRHNNGFVSNLSKISIEQKHLLFYAVVHDFIILTLSWIGHMILADVSIA